MLVPLENFDPGETLIVLAFIRLRINIFIGLTLRLVRNKEKAVSAGKFVILKQK